jgi:hypothetical protein
MPSTRHTEFAPFVLDLLDFMEEKLREAIADDPSQADAVSEAAGVLPLLRDRLRENEEVQATFILVFSDYLCARGGSFRSSMPSSALGTAMSLPVRSAASFGRAPSSRMTRMCCAASRTWRAKSRASSPCWASPDYEVALATRPAARAGDDAAWDWSEAKLDDAARRRGLAPQINSGEGAFYGPKLELALRDGLARSWRCSTVQLGVLPQRLEASYVAPESRPKIRFS